MVLGASTVVVVVVLAAADAVTAVVAVVDAAEDETLSVTGTVLSVICKTVVCDDASEAVAVASVTTVV